MEFLRLLRTARWVTTDQMHRRFFSHASSDATRKRLRKLVKGGYLVVVQEHRMADALFALGPLGKRVLEREGSDEIALERKLPKQIEHLIGINDIRIAAETGLPLSYFLACWELSAAGWQQAVVPDALFSVSHLTFAVEFDRGLETLAYFLRSKVSVYRRGLEGFPLSAVLIVADSTARMQSFLKAIPAERRRFLFTTIDLVRKQGLGAPIFVRDESGKGETLV